MKTTRTWAVAGGVLIAMGAVGVQADHHEDIPEILAMTYHLKVLPGHGLEFEKAYKDHLKMHHDAGDPQARTVWEVVSGRDVGSFYLRAGDLTWAGMDLETEIPDDREHIMKEVSPHIKSLSGMVSEMIPTVSNWPADYGVPKMVEVTMFSLDHAKMDDFFHGMHKIHEMIVDKELPYTYAWSKVVVGASGAQVYLSMPRKSWSEFKEPSPGLWDVAAEVMGKREADELRARIGAAIESQESFVVAHRSDLSYVPE